MYITLLEIRSTLFLKEYFELNHYVRRKKSLTEFEIRSRIALCLLCLFVVTGSCLRLPN